MTEIEQLRQEIQRLSAENLRLKDLLKSHGISWQPIQEASHLLDNVAEQKRRIGLFIKLFCARMDFYAERWESNDGRKGYSPACSNRWKQVCPKRQQKGIKCHECPERAWLPFTEETAYRHLIGQDERGRSFVAGTYALLENSTCKFLVFDFDDHDGSSCHWKEEARQLREICRAQGIDTALERSRSGNGAHIWIFFNQPIPARIARKFGAALLNKGTEITHQKDFNTFDRMMPTQDEMPAGGMGNLIALPLQGIPRKQGNSVFVDDNWNVLPDQWEYLFQKKTLSLEFVESKIKEWGLQNRIPSENVIIDEKEKPWEQKKSSGLEKSDIIEPLHLTLADCIYIPKKEIKPRSLNRIRKIATFSNPQFYKMQAMRYSTKQIPRYIQCFRDLEEYVTLPRGCIDELENKLNDVGISYFLEDCRTDGRAITVSFQGTLQPEQNKAVVEMLAYENGILAAATGFGKTVLGTYIIASRKVNTLILVHNREIMKEWQECIEKFLQIDEEIPEIAGKCKRKPHSIVGTLYSGHDSLHGIVDVAMISSLGRNESVDLRIQNYGMIIMDECHHAGAYTFENVLWKVKAKYVYGLTATPMREDGHEKIVFMQLGSVRYRLTEKESVARQNFRHEICPRFTSFVPVTIEKPSINDLYKLLVHDKIRNQMILEDILASIEEGRTPLVLTKFKDHAEYLFEMLREKKVYVILLMGGSSAKVRTERRNELENSSIENRLVIISTSKYIGEGFNFPRLDTLFLTVPISWKGNIAQYAGRLHRDYAGKENVIVYDYVDVHVAMLERMYQKRLSAYSSMGYTVYSPTGDSGNNIIYTIRDYQEVFWRDFHDAKDCVLLSSPKLGRQRVYEFVERVKVDQRSKIKFIVYTLTTDSYAEYQQKEIDIMKKVLRDSGVKVNEREELNCHYVIIDDDLVWYGSMNFLSQEHEDDILMRLRSEAIVKELLIREKQEKC